MRPDLQDLVDEVSRLLSAPTTLEDRDFNLVAFGSQAAEIDQVRQQSILQRRSTREVQEWFEGFGIAATDGPVRTPADPRRGVVARVCLPARSNGVTYGYLWLLDEHRHIDDALLGAAMHRAARAGAIMARQARAREHLESAVGDLLSPDEATVEAAAEGLTERGPIERDVLVVAVVLRVAAPDLSPAAPLNVWRLPRSVIASVTGEQVTLLVPLGDPADLRPVREAARQAWSLYSERLAPDVRTQLVAGIGGPRPDLAKVRGSWREGNLAVRVGHAVPALRPVVAWQEVGIYRLLACGPQQALRDAVIGPAVRRLLEQPDHELVRTAAAYLEHAGNAQRAAAELGIHRQTLYYRLRKVESLTGMDLTNGADRLQLHLGLTMLPLVGS